MQNTGQPDIPGELWLIPDKPDVDRDRLASNTVSQPDSDKCLGKQGRNQHQAPEV